MTIVDTNVLTREERAAISDELHDLIIDSKTHEAAAITARGLEAQLEYLQGQRGADELVDFVMDALDSFDKKKALGLIRSNHSFGLHSSD